LAWGIKEVRDGAGESEVGDSHVSQGIFHINRKDLQISIDFMVLQSIYCTDVLY
jgi:hypothetical protein